MQKLAVLVSGEGSLLEAIFRSGLRIHLVLADRRCRALEMARDMGVPVALVERRDFTTAFDRSAHTREVLAICEQKEITFIALAGYKTVLGSLLTSRYAGRILNIHPSLLPSFPGNHAVRDVLAAGVPVSGCTVHRVTAEVDDGEVLARKNVPVYPDDTEVSLHARIKEQEKILYPQIIQSELAKSA